jgi:uncharacterized membrane protein YbjE (DUF340 family)
MKIRNVRFSAVIVAILGLDKRGVKVEQLLNIAPVFLFLCAGMVLGKIGYMFSGKIMYRVVNTTLYTLLLFMGIRIARTPDIEKKLFDVGYISICIACATVVGTILVLSLLYYLTSKKSYSPKKEKSATLTFDNLIIYLFEPAKLLSFVIVGFCCGYFLPFFPGQTGGSAITWLLYLLLALVGIQLVESGVNIKKSFLHPETLIVPIGTIIGTFIGALFVARFIDLPYGKTLALASGFGWYTLSGVMITEMGDPILGSAGFIVNVFRESIALLLIPLLSKGWYPNIAIGVAGATSMDVTLPLISRNCGASSVPLSITSGSILTMLVPFLVPLFFYL